MVETLKALVPQLLSLNLNLIASLQKATLFTNDVGAYFILIFLNIFYPKCFLLFSYLFKRITQCLYQFIKHNFLVYPCYSIIIIFILQSICKIRFNSMIQTISTIGTTGENPPPLFDLKLVYSYLVEVADSESDLGLHGKPLVSEIFAFYHLLEQHEVDQDVVVMYTFVTIFLFKFF